SMGRSGSRMTAAAYTPPASGPRPASSTPAMRTPAKSGDPANRLCWAIGHLEYGTRRQLGGVAREVLVQRGEARFDPGGLGVVGQRGPGRFGQFIRRGVVLQ